MTTADMSDDDKPEVIDKRFDFVLLFDVQDGNPNGDPDAGNLPRVDPETGHGLVTDVCIKRKVRNYVLTAKNGEPGYDIFIKEKSVLNQAITAEYASIGIDLESAPKEEADGKKRKDKGKAQGSEVDRGRAAMCARYYDIRTFGAVMSTGPNAGQVRGPVQITFARSIDPIVSLEHSITRMAVATEEEAEKQGGDNRTMGRKATVPYALYRAHGFVSPALAEKAEGRRVQGTGLTKADLDLLWEALESMFEHDRSAARGLMTTRGLIIFEHDSKLGNERASALFDRVYVERRDAPKPARRFEDYTVKVDGEDLKEVRKSVPARASAAS
jgi:CRISPR-associated protein Csd2